ncbi:MAG: DUF2007 domain-containing protein [Bacteroidota bacterium]
MPIFKTIATFQYTSEAQIIKGRLETEGIRVFLQDHLTIDTDPLVSNAIGGVKLKVLADDALKAQHILGSMHKYALDDNGEKLLCPNCSSDKVELISRISNLKSLFAFLVSIISGTLPMYASYKHKCFECGHEFEIEEKRKSRSA